MLLVCAVACHTRGAALGKLLEHEGIEAVVPVWRSDVWGDGLREAGQKEFVGSVMDAGIRYDVDTEEFTALAEDLAGRVQKYVDEYGAEKVAVWHLGFSEMLQIVQDASIHEILGDVRWFGSGPNTKEINLINDAIGKEFLTGVQFTMIHAAPSKGPVADRVFKHVEGELRREPNSYSHAAYDAVWIAGLAISEIQDTDALKIREILPDIAAEYSGALGSITFNEAGDGSSIDYDVWSVRDGMWNQIGRYSQADDAVELAGSAPGISGEITIGRLADEDSTSSHYAENVEATELALVEFNRHLDEIGEGWSLVMKGADYDPSTALVEIKKFDSEGIKIIIGPENSAAVKEVKEYVDSNGMVILNCCSTAPELAVKDGIFRLVTDDTKQGAALAGILEHEGIEAIVPVWRGDVWGDGLIESLQAEYVELGVMDDGIRYDADASEFAGHAEELASRVQEYADLYGAEKTAVMYAGFGEIADFVRAAASHEILGDVRWFGSDASTKEVSIINEPALAEFSQKILFTAIQVGTQKNPTRELVERHVMDVLGRSPSTYASSAYDAVWIAGLAISEARSSDAAAVRDVIPLVAEMYSGAIGSTKLNEAGDLEQANYDIWGVRDGQWVLLGRYVHTGDVIGLG
ncbi:MAG: ABC transporter substrate-binding protein [Nitrosopumilus sp. H13]|nr:MAG: ABC transporter substrate-binding protein [Nitrosopumilus sp. H13]